LLSVIVVNVFPPEGHRRVNGPGREGGQGQDAGPFGGSGDGLQDDCFAFPPSFEAGVGGACTSSAGRISWPASLTSRIMGASLRKPDQRGGDKAF
jgi:hypothetical protein